MRWIVAFWGDQGLSFSRVFGATRPPAEFELIFDASPWGLGGVLATASSSEALQFFHEPLTTDDCSRFKVDLGDAKRQQHSEALSVLVGLKLWGPLLAKSQAIVKVKSDSVTALQYTAKLASSSPLLNGIGAEIALVLELHNIEEVFTQHVPGKLNDVADKLSRLAQPGVCQQLPPQLQGAKRRVTPRRDDSSWPGENCTTANLIATVSQNKWSKQCDSCLLSLFRLSLSRVRKRPRVSLSRARKRPLKLRFVHRTLWLVLQVLSSCVHDAHTS